MKRSATTLLVLLVCSAMQHPLSARGGGGRAGGGQMAARPAPMPMVRPSAPARAPSSSFSSYGTRPSTRPAPAPGGSATTLPSMPSRRPATQPAINKPGFPVAAPGLTRPGQFPSTQPGRGDLDPGFLRPATGSPAALPAGTLRPSPGGSLNKPGSAPQRPATLPARIPSRPNWQGRPPPPNRPDSVFNVPQIRNDPYLTQHLNNLPGGMNAWQNSRVGYWNNWYSARGNSINEFWNNHAARWDSISSFRRDNWSAIRNRTDAWRSWQGSVWGYRLARSYCVLDSTRDFYCNLFTPDWWTGCGWWHRPAFGRPVNPWWWWRPCTWSTWTYVYSEPAPVPVTDDYGTDIVIEGDQVYVDGQPVASASDYRAQAVQIGNPAAAPGPPAPPETEGASEEWMPLGVWALTQESEGDAHMFYQLSVEKGGVISGAYTNVLTGGSDPVSGSVDKASQRVVWHTGDATATMVETNLNGLTGDHTTAMVHFPSGATQTWLLVRLPSPDLPATPVPAGVKGGAAAAPSR